MEFIGREDELEKFRSRFQSPNAELIFLYGRRRVGKTEFLRKFAEGKKAFFFSATESADFDQRSRFKNELLAFGIDCEHALLNDWQGIFRNLSKLRSDKKTLVIIDEFQYMFIGNKAIPSTLQNEWDVYLSKSNIMLVLCGSAMSFIEQKVLGGKNPLYGRATAIFKMKELPFSDAVRFFPKFTPQEKVIVYSILGGVPHYLKQFSPELNLVENIKQNILSRETILYNEIEFLLNKEFREVAVYNTIISAIAFGNTKLNEISQKTMLEGSKANAYINNLIEVGIVAKEFSVLDSIRDGANIQRGIYRIQNNFFRFWYKYIYPNKSEIELGYAANLADSILGSANTEFCSYVFEDICREFVTKLNFTGKLPIRARHIGKVFAKNLEVEIGALADKTIILGECKWTNAPIDTSVLRDLQEKGTKYPALSVFSSQYYYLFSKCGFTKGLLDIAACETHVKLFSLEDVLAD